MGAAVSTHEMRAMACMDQMAKDRGVRVGFKTESGLMKLLGGLLWFNKAFMTRFTTSAPGVVWFPNRGVLDQPARYARVMAHELVHLDDQLGIWRAIRFGLMYFFPQWLGLLGLLGLLDPMVFGASGGHTMWPFFILLVCFGPWPSPGRMHLEMRGYAISIASWKWIGGTTLYPTDEWVEEHCASTIENFVSGNYYWMWPFRKSVVRQLKRWIERINDGTIDQHIRIAPELRQRLSGGCTLFPTVDKSS